MEEQIMMMKYRGPYEESAGSSSAEETALRRSLLEQERTEPIAGHEFEQATFSNTPDNN